MLVAVLVEPLLCSVLELHVAARQGGRGGEGGRGEEGRQERTVDVAGF
jgi:hypothetical protein